ncbi:related to switching protein SWI10 [Cephalotrichum gorgonifer]|uniref:Related to switching protein SWI10 n=1 Tax=Cephalotrichum gorgonifer TaxID=2041049 RepID=A0AAE8MZR5_9PEZI|nr:related to switching protein SWI10 [Cephalotrichum gorgonifer]
MDDDFDDPELWEAADRAASAAVAASASASSQRQREPQQQHAQVQGHLDKRPPPRASASSEGGRVVQPTPQRLDKPPPPRAVASSSEGKVVQPTPQALPQRSSGSSILVSQRQKGNPILQCIKSVPWEYSDIVADYVLGTTTCALFLSLKYHRLYPEYIYGRIRNLQGKYNLRVLLAMVDIANHEDPLRELTKMSLISNVTLILCWSAAEAARYLELYKSYEHANFKAIQGQQGTSYVERLVDFVTVPRGVNKSDAVSLVSNFGSLKNAINADPEQIAIISGWGEVKVKRWRSAIDEPFRIKKTARRTIADVAAATSYAGIDPRLAMKSGQAPTTTPDSAAAEAGQASAAKPRQFQFFDPGSDDEEAMLAAAIEESKKTSQQVPPGPSASASPRKTREPEALSEGVAGALARLREQG